MIHKQHYNVYISSCEKDGGIYHYRVDEKGNFNFINKYSLDRPMYAVIEGNTLFALLRQPFEKESGLISLEIDDNGNLSNKSSIVSTQGEVACHLAVDNGNVYCVNYSSGSVIKLPERLITHCGNSIHPTRQTMPHPHFVCVTPDENYICVADLGMDKIIVYDKELNFVSTANVPCGHGARHLVFSNDGNMMFCANELASTISVFSYNDGNLEMICTYSALPSDFKGESTVAAIRVAKDGKYLYVSNRGHNSICCFEIYGNKLELQGFTDCGGDSPRDFNMIGDYLICGNENSNLVTIFHIDGANLIKHETELKIPSPVCITVTQEQDDIEILKFEGEGYMPLISSDGWRVAMINYIKRLNHNNFCRMERHLLTDEAFILLSGSATLVIGEDKKVIHMEKKKIYKVNRNRWHGICLSEDACVVVMENDNTSEENTEYIFFDEKMRIEDV